MINQSTKRMLYGAWIAVVALVCLIVLFPSQALKQYITVRISSQMPAIGVRIATAGPSLPPGVQLKGVHFFRTDRPLFDLDRLKIMPKLLSLFGSETAYRFNGSAYSGSIIGVARLPAADSNRSMTAEAEISRLELGEVPFLKHRLPLNVTGRLSGTMKMANPDDLTAELTVDDCRLELATPLLNIDTLVFRKIEADVALMGNRLDIRRLRMNGNQLDADLVGTVMLAGRSGDETLNLSGTVVPRPELLAAMGGVTKQLLAGNKRSKGRMPITITGTMERPAVAFN